MEKIILACDSHHGIYIPQLFIRECGKNIVNFKELEYEFSQLESPENEYYWESWERVLDVARFSINDNDYHLEHVEDLWYVLDGHSFEECCE